MAPQIVCPLVCSPEIPANKSFMKSFATKYIKNELRVKFFNYCSAFIFVVILMCNELKSIYFYSR